MPSPAVVGITLPCSATIRIRTPVHSSSQENVTFFERPPNALHGSAGLHGKSRQLPEPGDELLGEPLCEIRVCRVRRQVVEVQHRDAVKENPRPAPGVSTSRTARWGRAVRALGLETVVRR